MDQFQKNMQEFDALPQEQKLTRLEGLDEQTMQAFAQQYGNWRKTRKPATQPKSDQSAPGFYQGSPRDLDRPPKTDPLAPKSTGMAAKIRAAGGAATAGLLPYAADLAQQAIGKTKQRFFGGPQAPSIEIGSGPWQDQYKKDVEQNTGSAFAGGIAGGLAVPTPAAAIRGVGGAIGTGVRALQGAIFGGAGAGSAGSDIQTGAAIGGAAGVGVPLVVSGVAAAPGAIQQFLVGKLAPSAMNMVRSMAQSILTAKGTPQAYGQLLKTPSKLGLGSRWDDMLYYVVNKLKPQILQPIAERNARLAQQVSQAGKRVGQIKQPMKQMVVPAQQLTSDLASLARRAQLDRTSGGAVGKQSAQVIRQQYMPVPAQVATASRPQNIDLGISEQIIPQKMISIQTPSPVPSSQQPIVSVVPQTRRTKISSGKRVKRPLQDENVFSSGQVPDQTWRPQQFGNQIVPDKSVQLPGVSTVSDPAARYRQNMSGTSGASVRYSGDPAPVSQQVLAKTQSLKKLAGDIGPIKSTQLPSDDVAGRFFDPMQSRISLTQPLAQTRPRQAMQIAGQIQESQAGIPLGQLQQRRVQLEGGQYKPGTQISTPQAAVTRANQLIQDYTLRKAGYSDLARSRLAQAGDEYHIANKTMDVLSQHGQPGQGMTANTPFGQMLGFVGQSIKQRGAPILLKPASAISNRAINLVNKWGRQSGQFVPTDVAQKAPFLPPSQKAQLVRKFQAIAGMRPQDAKIYAFAQSMSNPMFRQFWMLAQKEQQDNE